MGLLVRASRELAHVGGHRVAGHEEEHVGASAAALLPLLELESAGVRDEVGLPESRAHALAGVGEEVILRVVTILEDVVAVEGEFAAAHRVDLQGRGRGGEDASRLLPVQVEVLIVGVQGR